MDINDNYIPKVSVVVPVFNRSGVIKRCLESVINQTAPPFEIIVVDDLSTDNTIEVVSQIRDSRIKIIQLEEKGGAQAARNRGVAESQGNWIAFLDSDDIWVFDKLHKQLQALKACNYDPKTVFYTDYYVREANTEDRICRLRDYSIDNAYKLLLLVPGPMFQGLLVSKTTFLQSGFLDENVVSWQEWDAFLVLSKANKLHHIPEPLFIYQVSANSISKNAERDVLGYDYVLNKHKESIHNFYGKLALQNQFYWNLNRGIEYGLGYFIFRMILNSTSLPVSSKLRLILKLVFRRILQ